MNPENTRLTEDAEHHGTLTSCENNLPFYEGRNLTWVTARVANQISPRGCFLRLLLMAFVCRRGGCGSARLLASDTQKVTSLKLCIVSPLDCFRGNNNNTNYVGFLRGTCLVAFREGLWWFVTFSRGSAGNLAFRSLKWRCWSNRCVIMLLPTRVGEKKPQVISSGEAVCRQPAPEVSPGLWWKLDQGWVDNTEPVYVFAAKVLSLHQLAWYPRGYILPF